MAKNEEELKKFLKKIKRENIIFRPHFYDKQKEDRQYLSESLVINSIRDIGRFFGFQDQSTKEIEKYRVAIKLSSKYTLVVVSEVKDKNLYIITAWKTSRKWQKAIQK